MYSFPVSREGQAKCPDSLGSSNIRPSGEAAVVSWCAGRVGVAWVIISSAPASEECPWSGVETMASKVAASLRDVGFFIFLRVLFGGCGWLGSGYEYSGSQKLI